jgi:tRNA threonylcarbamoyladenosine biosynthesis protein TsaE
MSLIKIDLTLNQIDKAAESFLSQINGFKQFAFYGSMGSGKTTFITALCSKLKALDLVSSPTFSIVNEYETDDGEIIYHFDFYRIKNSEELFDIGFEEYVATNNWCFIEWPEKAEELLPSSFVKVLIEEDLNGNRVISFNTTIKR